MYKNIDICYIDYITVKYSYYAKINSVNLLYLIISEADGYIKQKTGSKYLVFDTENKNYEFTKKYNELPDGIKKEIGTINGCKTSRRSSDKHDKDFIKIKFSSDDNLPLKRKN